MLLNWIRLGAHPGESSARIVLDTELVIRNSCGCKPLVRAERL
jgi:hypothetical protein